MRIVTTAALVIALAVISTVAFAAITWNGSVPPDPASFINGQVFTYNYGGLGYTRQYNEGGEAYIRFNGTNELIRANGWFVEARVKVTAPTSLNWNAGMFLGDNIGGGAFLIFSSTQLQAYQNDDGTFPFTVNWNANRWNIVRLTMPAGGTVNTPIEVRLNGTLVGSITAKNYHSMTPQVVNLGDMTSGLCDVAWDYLNINFEEPTSLTGNITLEDYTGDLDLAPVKIEMVPTSGGMARTENVTLAPNTEGYYSITNVVPGTYNVHFSACKWQDVTVSNVIVQTGPAEASPTLKNGDLDGDDGIDGDDVNVVLKNTE